MKDVLRFLNEKIKASDLSRPVGEQVVDAMRSLWVFLRGEKAVEGGVPAFNKQFWHKELSFARTRWLIEGLPHKQANKLIAEARCLNKKGTCPFQCPTPSTRTCPAAVECVTNEEE